ncbi:MAG: glycosyltransferase family 2 protein [Lachnospiraceae bacterium]|nr:glycosyltransferase family 2 protein [Lachnospiraceae bacterium]
MTISVIIPIYDVEKYLDKCLQSVRQQTYRDLEIILVNDGSKDGSLSICEKHAGQDCRIKIINQENKGLSAARNSGIDVASGEYICFIDSDDWIASDYCERLLNACVQYGVPLSMCSFYRVSGDENSVRTLDGETQLLDQNRALHFLDYREKEEYILIVAAWNKMYARNLFQNLRYPEGKFHEDEFVIGELLLQVPSVAWVSQKMYFYRQREDSITGRENRDDVRHLQVLEAYGIRMSQFLESGKHDMFQICWRNYMLTLIEWLAVQQKTGKKIRHNNLYIDYGRMLKKYHKKISAQYKLKYGLFWMCPSLFLKIFSVRDVS